MAQITNLIVTTNAAGGTKSYIRIGDTSPSSSLSLTGSSIQFLQDLSNTNSTFDSAITSGYSAFRIRHDTINGLLVFQGTSGSHGPYQLLTLNDDTNTVTFGGAVSFDDIYLDQITASSVCIGTHSILKNTVLIDGSLSIGSTFTADGVNALSYGNSNDAVGNYSLAGGDSNVAIGIASHAQGYLNIAESDYSMAFGMGCKADVMGQIVIGSYNSYGVNSIFTIGSGTGDAARKNSFVVDLNGLNIFQQSVKVNKDKIIYFSGSSGTASIWYDDTTNKIKMDGGGGNSWRTQIKLTESVIANIPIDIYTSSETQLIQNSNYLSVFLNGEMLYSSQSSVQWDYKILLGTPAKISFSYNLPYSSQDEWWLGFVYNGGAS